MNNINTGVSSALDGTKTAENLRQAFSKEAEAFTKGSILASIANGDGDISAWRLLLEQAENDKNHAELWLEYLDELGDTVENLSDLSLYKSSLSDDLYPIMAEIADEEGFEEIAEKMRLISAVKKAQSDALSSEKDAISMPEALTSENPETFWHCRYCGYDVKGNTPPERCPLCSYPRSFTRGS